ncbi:MAG: low-density lipoprotein receptor class A repeat-containing protein [Candidatus Endonucleobacter bathymodioli]|uniref:Low-density lipoprotein receptor class A repeat-containing protein n=1 Tax=Candidatus Endonucleibacter bathymodioli TaxID=539814 RepID=A0AA90NNQ9_9GAMM|nr:low-density lipoprotein receptor class A repeat-containing protein [Candidatus Endonucleobacter bathymodioli]
MISLRYTYQLLLGHLSKIETSIFNITTFLTTIDVHRRLHSKLQRSTILSFFYNFKLLKHIHNAFKSAIPLATLATPSYLVLLSSRGLPHLPPHANTKSAGYINPFLFLLMALPLLVTSLTYATNDNRHNITPPPPVTIFLNSPNYLANCFALLAGQPVIKVHSFLKRMIQLETDEDETSYTEASRVFFSQSQGSEFNSLYCLYQNLSLRYYKSPSATDFMRYMIYNEPVQVVTRPLMAAMLKLCDDYNDRLGITIGKMLAEVEGHKYTDENINAFLRYKSNRLDVHDKYLYISKDASTKESNANNSDKKERRASWFSRCIQRGVNYAQSIVTNASGLASKAMLSASLSSCMLSPAGADNSQFNCTNGQTISQSYACDGFWHCHDGSDESVSTCCKNGELNATTRFCPKHDDPNKSLFVCDDNQQTIPEKWSCDGTIDALLSCRDGSDDTPSSCCEGGLSGVNATTRICPKKGKPSDKIYVCDNKNQTIPSHWQCVGFSACTDGSDEKASDCCEGGILGINTTTKTCPSKGDPNNHFFVCDNKQTVPLYFRCVKAILPIRNCKDKSDLSITGANPTCFRCNNNDLILAGLRCNGQTECSDGSDEFVSTCCENGVFNTTTRLCPKKGHPTEEIFICNNDHIIPSHLRCTGFDDCFDGSDEKASDCCENGTLGINTTTKTCPKKGDPATHLFVCNNNQTVPLNFRCVKSLLPNHNCQDKSDLSVSGASPTCFSCHNNNALILAGLRCNGQNDCGDGSDESVAATNPTCFNCGNETLIVSGLRCNGEADCFDSSDESVNGTNPSCFHCENGAILLSENSCNCGNDCPDYSSDVEYTSADFIIPCVLVAGVITCAAYAAMLVKYRNIKKIKGALKWLLSPITELTDFFYSLPPKA